MKNLLVPLAGLMLLAQQALGLGLGEAIQSSYLGEPFSAKIPVLDSQDWTADQINITVTSDSATLTRDFDTALSKSSGGRYVTLSTNNPVREPYIEFVVELKWPQGTIQRQYQLLLDPPRKPG